MKDICKVRYKTCTLDSGLDDGLDYRLNFGLGWTVISSELAVYRRVFYAGLTSEKKIGITVKLDLYAAISKTGWLV